MTIAENLKKYIDMMQDEYDAIAEMEAQDRYGEELQRFEETQREDK